MDSDLLRQVLTSTVVAGVIAGLTQLALRLNENRARRKEKAGERSAADEAADDARREREHGAWDAMQSAYSAHLTWDFRAAERIRAHVRQIHELQDELKDTRSVFEPIGEPPPLRPPPKILPPPT